MYDHGVPTADAIALGFPHPVLPRIDEPPARMDIDMEQEIQTETPRQAHLREEAESTAMQQW